MKRALPFFLLLIAAGATAQTLNVNTGQVTYAYPADELGDVTVAGTELTIAGTTYAVADISSMAVDTVAVADNAVSVVYNDDAATVVIAGNLAGIVSAAVDGAHVTLLQGDASDEITYTLSGSSSDGSLYMDGSLKATFVLAGVTLSNPDSAAINIQDGKRIAIELADGTTSTLTDGLTGTDDGSDGHKACLYVQGHTEFSGAGELVVNGNVKHGITSHEYCLLKKSVGAITINSANDGFHIDQYFEQKGGEITVNSKGDGIDVSATDDKTDENNGQIIISGGTLTSTVSGETSYAMKCDSTFTMSDGTVKLLATGDGGRALNVNGSASISGGYIEGVTMGGIYDEDGPDEKKPHAMAVDEDVTFTGGEIYFASMSNKGFKIDGTFLINGGTILGIGGKEADTPSSDSQQVFKTYSKQTDLSGEVTYDDVVFTLPTGFEISSKGYVLVSRAGLTADSE
ncbi:MAG: carbohydrate-binding domain-containing protein [Prevotella sp.]|nr:carbohydrate-binding domain-containing protein [Prevotella sp.]